MALNQAKMTNPLGLTPHLLVGPPPMPDPPRDRIYSKPFWKGLANRNRAEAMTLDPHADVVQQQQRQNLLPEQQQSKLEARQDSSQHHRHHRSQHHRHHDNHPENQQPGFFGRLRRLFGGSASEERAEYHSSRHHDLQHHRHGRHASELHRVTPAHSRPESSRSRHHRDTRRGSYDDGAHSFSGFDAEASFYQSHPNGHGSRLTYGSAHDQWGHKAPMPGADELFIDPTRHPQHMGGAMFYNGPHEAYEYRYTAPYGPVPQR